MQRGSAEYERGFTLLELSIGMALFAFVMAAVASAVLHLQSQFTETAKEHSIESGYRLAYRLSDELMTAHWSSLNPLVPVNAPSMQYQDVIDWVADAVVLGPVKTIAFELAAGELANGLDDNGDGRADEGFVTLGEAGGPTIRVAGNVLGLRFNKLGDSLSFEVDLGVINGYGELTTKTFSQVVSFRIDWIPGL